MAIAEDDIERVRTAVSIVDVVGQHVQLRRAGRNWVGLCPFHAERTPSFNVRAETGRYKCFGCDASGDVFTFVQEIEHTDFVGAVEQLAARAGVQLTYTSTGQSKTRERRKRLQEAMSTAVDWYHQRLLTDPAARAARDYLRNRGLSGEVAREFRLGWAPDAWDELCRNAGIDAELLRDTGLGFVNRTGRLQDAFRARVLFPIFDEQGAPVAFGGRVLPGSTDPAKYKNSPETTLYTKSKTLYGLNWSKGQIVQADQVIVCEGYTDVIGFHRAGLPRSVATCGTAFTEEHVRLIKRYASRVVLAFDADAAGQGAAERFYEWEQKYEIEVAVARLPDGRDPGDLAGTDPEALVAAVAEAVPFLAFRLERVMSREVPQSPEQRVRLGERALGVINEHPNLNVRKLYAGQVASQLGLPVADLVDQATRGQRRPQLTASVVAPRRDHRDNAEFVAIVLLVHDWEAVAPWLIEPLFADDLNRRAFRALADTGGELTAALGLADPEAKAVLERAAVVDVDADAEAEALNLIAAAARRQLTRDSRGADPDAIRLTRDARLRLEDLQTPEQATASAEWLLGWLYDRAMEQFGDHTGAESAERVERTQRTEDGEADVGR
jgi:DNA primase